ncbi:hypothetical protein BY996DRAFT_7867902 [Phakopsora pachyrhizi]|nr:hypothetical protein BY996DRAFT_7867902 [Phakopsora pachyrhizi]
MGIELKFDSEYKNYMDEISKMRLENRGSETTTVDSFQKLKCKVYEAKFDKLLLTANLDEWKRRVYRTSCSAVANLNKRKPNYYDPKTVKHGDNDFQWGNSNIIQLTNLYNRSYYRNNDPFLESQINKWLGEIKYQIHAPKEKDSYEIFYAALLNDHY